MWVSGLGMDPSLPCIPGNGTGKARMGVSCVWGLEQGFRSVCELSLTEDSQPTSTELALFIYLLSLLQK